VHDGGEEEEEVLIGKWALMGEDGAMEGTRRGSSGEWARIVSSDVRGRGV